jgi:cellobiose epimerase
MHTVICLDYSAKARNELAGNILPFWANNVLLKHGADFAGQMKTDLTVVENAPKGIILISRILWTFSAAYVALGETSHKACADAYFNLFKPFVDQSYGGVYWLLDSNFAPRDTKKENIAQAFAIHGLAEYYNATHNASALDMAIALFHAVEQHSHDSHGSGYLDGHDRQWQQVTEPVKSFETHYNLMNAYANLLRVWDDDLLRSRLKELLQIMLDKFTDGAWHMQHFFGADWSPRPNRIQYGHDIIVSWLLVDCADALGDSQLIARAKDHAVRLARGVLQQAYDRDLGGIYHSISAEGQLNTDKVWWCQAEAVVGFLNAYAISGDQEFLDAALRTWDFIEQHLIDRQYGEWYYSTTKEGLPHTDLLKVSEWKCPYHNGRACLEVIKRMARIVLQGT